MNPNSTTGVSTFMNNCDLLIVGAGLYGLTIAERAASYFQLNCLLVDTRNHIGGNAYSYFHEDSGIEVHKFGSHLFHTNSSKIFSYIRQFTSLSSYIHRVKALVDNKVFTLPFNLHTLNQIYGRYFSPTEALKLLSSYRLSSSTSRIAEETFESKALSSVGPEIYEILIKGYTEKQWQISPSLLPAATISRIPVRLNFDDRYFEDKYQGLPSNGYSSWFKSMTKNPRIQILTNTDYFEILPSLRNVPTIYTGPLDRYFDFKFGSLGWRTLDFEFEILEIDDFQGTSVMNYPSLDIPFTRIHEFKHLHPERNHIPGKTIIAKEFSRTASIKDEPYYPINSQEDRKKLVLYRKLMDAEPIVHFGGRLGTYQYLDMHMAIGSALQFMESEFSHWYSNAKSLCKIRQEERTR